MIFRGIFLGISWGNNFLKLSAENSNFPQHVLRGKISPKFSPEKMFEKLAPGRPAAKSR
jgi:hypothetical protein